MLLTWPVSHGLALVKSARRVAGTPHPSVENVTGQGRLKQRDGVREASKTKLSNEDADVLM